VPPIRCPGTPGGPGATPLTARPTGAAGPTHRGPVVRSLSPGLSWTKHETSGKSAATSPMIVGSDPTGVSRGSA